MSDLAQAPPLVAVSGRPPNRWRALLRSPSGMTGLVIVVLLLILSVVSLLGLLPYDPIAQDPPARLQPPSGEHWFGTDQFGRDVFSRVAAGVANSALVAIVAVTFATVVGTLGGLVAGFIRGVPDVAIGAVTNVLFAFPPLLLALTLASVFTRNWFTVAVAIAVVYVPIFVRVTRGPVLTLREVEFVKAATTTGQSRRATMFRHVLPNIGAIIIVQVTLSLSWAVLTEASLSFLGLGTPPPAPSLGSMVYDARTLVQVAPWTMLAPGARDRPAGGRAQPARRRAPRRPRPTRAGCVMTAPTLRDAGPADLDAVVRVFLECFRVTYAARLPSRLVGSMSDEDARSLWSRALTTPGREVVVAQVDDEVCGVVGFAADGEQGLGALALRRSRRTGARPRVDVAGPRGGPAPRGGLSPRIPLGLRRERAVGAVLRAARLDSRRGHPRRGSVRRERDSAVPVAGGGDVTAAAPILEIRHLTVVFGTTHGDRTAVQDISLSVPAGATVALVGESGSGKSTTAAAVSRLLPPNGRVTSGSIELDGRDLLALGERDMRRIRGAGIGLVPQDPMSNLDPLMRIGDQVAEALEVHDVATGKAAWARAVELLELVGIPDPTARAAQYPHEFSGGMRQRALIAMGLACRPRLLVADEPTSALDVTVQRRILDTVDAITDELGTSVLLITHDLGLAAERADTVAVMYRGEIVETGPAARILAEPEHDYTSRLLARGAESQLRPGRRGGPGTTPSPPSRWCGSRASASGSRYAGAVAARATTSWPSTTCRSTSRAGRPSAIVGESGSGKSTTANLLLGLEIPTSGRILVEGQDLATMSRRETFALRRRIQPVFQNPYASLDPRYTVERSVAEPLKVHGVGTPDERRERVRTLLAQVALDTDLAARLPHELSGGQRQRVAIARALALEPDIVVLDEAVSALDVIVQAQILELLADLQDRLGLTYLFISHDLAVVRMVSDQVHVMRAGRLVESGPPDQIFAAPQDDYTRELLAAIPGPAR